MTEVNVLNCPSKETLSELIAGTIDDCDILNEHIKKCDDCQAVLDRLSGSEVLSPFRNQPNDKVHDHHSLDPPLRENDLGSIGDLAIEEEIGRGGAGVVFRAFDSELDRQVAVKVLYKDVSQRSEARFERETKAAASLSSDYLVDVLSVGRTRDQRPYLLMPLIHGKSLKEHLSEGMLHTEQAARYIRHVATGLQTVHEGGFIHRDIKPANILIDSRNDRANLTDFGLARSEMNETLTHANVICGTPEYMSPEQASGHELDSATDIYSLGAALYHCLTGTPPFRGQPIKVLEQHQETDPVAPSRLNPDVPRDLETICLKALAKHPRLRYLTAQDMAEDLQRFSEGRPVIAKPISSAAVIWKWCKRNRAMATVMGLFAISLILGTVVSTTYWLKSENNAAMARAFADDLNANRESLRDSISRFQARVFSQEAMHWQMTPTVRREMFRDVIAYLDEFGSLEEPQQFQSTTPAELVDQITEDYLAIAEAALDVGAFEEAELAAERALARIRKTAETTWDSQSSEVLLQESKVLRILVMARSKLTSREPTQQLDLAKRSRDTAAKAFGNDPGNVEIELAVLQARLLVLKCAPTDQQHRLVELDELYSKLSTLDNQENPWEMSRTALITAIDVGWQIAEQVDDERAVEVLQQNEFLCGRIREHSRNLNRTMALADYLRGENRIKLAKAWRHQGDQDKALETEQSAERDLKAAVNANPQNIVWRTELVDLLVQSTNSLLERSELRLAAKRMNDAIQHSVAMLKNDPKNLALRIKIIKMFVKLAGISELENELGDAAQEYYVAAQDCRLLFRDEETRPWAFRTRLWLLSKVVALLGDAKPSFQNDFPKIEAIWIKGLKIRYPDCDASMVQPILDGAVQPPRPDDLGI